MRKRAMVGWLGAVCCALSSARAAAEVNSWVGREVLPKGPGVRIGFTDADDQEKYVATLTDLIYTVDLEQDPWIHVSHEGAPGWFPRPKSHDFGYS